MTIQVIETRDVVAARTDTIKAVADAVQDGSLPWEGVYDRLRRDGWPAGEAVILAARVRLELTRRVVDNA